MCGGSYLNGWFSVVLVQLLALSGLLFSIATLADCSFIELDERLFFPEDMDKDLPLKVTQTQFVGFLTWKQLDGSCYWYTSGENWENQLDVFHDKLGSDWELPRLVTMISCCLSFVYCLYLLSFTCSSQVRGVRYFNAVFLCVVLTALQGVTFVAFASSFCDEYGCTFSRTAYLAVAAMACYFLSGICFCCTSDYPGPSWKKKAPTLMATNKVAPQPRLSQTRGAPSGRMQRESLQTYNAMPTANPEVEDVMPDYEEEVFEEVTEHDDDEQVNVNGSSQEVFNVLEASRSIDDESGIASTQTQEVSDALEASRSVDDEGGVDSSQSQDVFNALEANTRLDSESGIESSQTQQVFHALGGNGSEEEESEAFTEVTEDGRYAEV